MSEIPHFEIDIVEHSGDWSQLNYEPIVQPVIRETLNAVNARQDDFQKFERIELVIILSDNEYVRQLNQQYRGKDKPTNVLSFPNPHLRSLETSAHVGDLVFALSTLIDEATAEGKQREHHFAHLVVHGLLHLLGYDHMTEAEANVMEKLEFAVLQKFDIPNPY